MNARRPYPSDVTDEEWRQIQDLIPPERSGGRKREVDEREIVNAIFYVLSTKCAWRYLPHDYPPWGTVYYYYGQWQANGTLRRIRRRLKRPLDA